MHGVRVPSRSVASRWCSCKFRAHQRLHLPVCTNPQSAIHLSRARSVQTRMYASSRVRLGNCPSQITGFVRSHFLPSLPADYSLGRKYVLSFSVVPAITHAATSDNTSAADSPYNLILETTSRRPRSQVSGTQQALRKTCTNDASISCRRYVPISPFFLPFS